MTIKHTLKQHPGQDIKVDRKLLRKRDIFKLAPWTPLAEALTKTNTGYWRASNRQDKPQEKPQRQTKTEPTQKPYRAITIEQALGSIQPNTDRTPPSVTTTGSQLMNDLYLSSTDTSASSSTTDLQEEPGRKKGQLQTLQELGSTEYSTPPHIRTVKYNPISVT